MSALSDLLRQAKAGRSIDAIAQRARQRGHPINRATVAKYLAGEHGPRPSERTLRALAEGLGVDLRRLRRALGVPGGELGPYQPVAESARLTQVQREALDQLIRSMVARADAGNLAKADAGRDLHDSVTEPGVLSVSSAYAARTAADALGGDVYVGEPASAAELRE